MNRGHDKFELNMKSKTSQKRTHGKLNTYRILQRILAKLGNKCRTDSTGFERSLMNGFCADENSFTNSVTINKLWFKLHH